MITRFKKQQEQVEDSATAYVRACIEKAEWHADMAVKSLKERDQLPFWRVKERKRLQKRADAHRYSESDFRRDAAENPRRYWPATT